MSKIQRHKFGKGYLGHCPLIFMLAVTLLILTACATAQQRTPSPPDKLQPNKAPQCPATVLPWDINWLPTDLQQSVEIVNAILQGSGLANQGSTIVQLSKQYRINPAVVLSMFRKESSFAALNTRANRNNNPGNIVATGGCRGLAAGVSCQGVYGEVGTDGRFGQYRIMADGIAAYYMLLSSEYQPGSKYNCQDLACIVNLYAPPGENDTNAYVKQITDWTKQYECQIVGAQVPLVSAPGPIQTPQAIGATVTYATQASSPTVEPNAFLGEWKGNVPCWDTTYANTTCGTDIEIIKGSDGKLVISDLQGFYSGPGTYQEFQSKDSSYWGYCFYFGTPPYAPLHCLSLVDANKVYYLVSYTEFGAAGYLFRVQGHIK